MLNTPKHQLFQELNSAADRDNGELSAYYVIVPVFPHKIPCPQAKHFSKWFDGPEKIVLSGDTVSYLQRESIRLLLCASVFYLIISSYIYRFTDIH